MTVMEEQSTLKSDKVEDKNKNKEETAQILMDSGNKENKYKRVDLNKKDKEMTEEHVEAPRKGEFVIKTRLGEVVAKGISKKPSSDSMKEKRQEKYPLNCKWTFWLDRAERGVNKEEFEKNLKSLHTVEDVWMFWHIFYAMPSANDLVEQTSLHLMKEGIKPIWETPYNSKGGTYRFHCHKEDSNQLWKEVVMAAVGEKLSDFATENDEIVGVSVTPKDKCDIVSIWNTDSTKNKCHDITNFVQSLVPDMIFDKFFYKAHTLHFSFDKQKLGSRRQANKFGKDRPFFR